MFADFCRFLPIFSSMLPRSCNQDPRRFFVEAEFFNIGMDSTLYRQLIGSLMYLVHTRPDICYIVNVLSQFMSDPKHIHLVADKHVLIYVRGTITYGLRYTSNSAVLLSGYSYSNWASSAIDWKSTFGYCFSMGSTMISWSSKKQGSIAQSTAEA